MDYTLGYDCDNREIEEYTILRAIWTNDIDISELPDADPRFYCALYGYDGNAYAISVYDNWNEKEIREREHILPNESIPTIIKPISEMKNYEIAFVYDPCGNGFIFWEYDFNRDELKNKLNYMLKKNKVKCKTKKI